MRITRITRTAATPAPGFGDAMMRGVRCTGGALFAALALLAAVAVAGDAVLVSQDALLGRLAANDPELVVLDVRTAEEFAQGHVPGARNIPHGEIESRLAELAGARDQDLVLYCRSGRRTELAAESLRKAGFTRLYHLQGDFLGWAEAGRAVEQEQAATDPER